MKKTLMLASIAAAFTLMLTSCAGDFPERITDKTAESVKLLNKLKFEDEAALKAANEKVAKGLKDKAKLAAALKEACDKDDLKALEKSSDCNIKFFEKLLKNNTKFNANELAKACPNEAISEKCKKVSEENIKKFF